MSKMAENPKRKERFKVSVLDRVTGEKQVFNVHSAGFAFTHQLRASGSDTVRMVLENPRSRIEMKLKGNK